MVYGMKLDNQDLKHLKPVSLGYWRSVFEKVNSVAFWDI